MFNRIVFGGGLIRNTIYLGGLSFDSDLKKEPMIASYSDMRYGEGVLLVGIIFNINGSILLQSEVNLCKMSKIMVIIVGQKSESLEVSKHILVIEISFHNNNTMDTQGQCETLCIFLLCLAVLGDREVFGNVACDNDLLPSIKHWTNYPWNREVK